jgi:hypothetical protein
VDFSEERLSKQMAFSSVNLNNPEKGKEIRIRLLESESPHLLGLISDKNSKKNAAELNNKGSHLRLTQNKFLNNNHQ